jgi:dTDP-glucose 4,6-dehydratase
MIMNWAGKTAIVTGGAGFIGSHLVDGLVAAGANVVVADCIQQIGTANIAHLADRVRIVDCDVAANGAIAALGKADAIFHLAALAVPSACEKNPEIAFRVNVQGTFNVLRHALESGVEKVVFPSTAQLYGRYPKYLPIDEQHPIEISGSVYNATKKIGEELCNLFYEKHGLPVVWLRLFNCFGPRQTPDYLIPTIISQGLSGRIDLWNERPTRDFTYVGDTAAAFIKAAETRWCGGPINIGSGREVATGDLARQVATGLGSELTFQNREVTGCMRMLCDRRRAAAVLGWEPSVPFEQGLNMTIDWWKSRAAKK